MESFTLEACKIPDVWCGDGDKMKDDVLKKYTGKGTAQQCLQKGIGMGMHLATEGSIKFTSLRNIRYITELYEKRFIPYKIKDIASLISVSEGMTKVQVRDMLAVVLKTKKGKTDARAYNSILVYLFKHSVKKLPPCIQPS